MMAQPVITEFEDSKPTLVTGNPPNDYNPIMGPATQGIAEFLRRPVKIYGGLSTAGDLQLLPLKAFLDNAAVTAKIANYQLLKATVCVRYSESAMPFVYGCRQLSAVPFLASGVQERFINVYAKSHLLSQYTNPTVGNPLVMRLPFFGSRLSYVIKDIKDNIQSQWIYYVSNVVPYARCDVNTAPTTTCSVHVWLEDVELQVPLATDATYQSEYNGVISTPATIVASAAKTLSAIPMLAPFTNPVENAASMIAKFGRNFGFSRPIQLEPPGVFSSNPDQNMSVSTYLDIAQKMTTDPKQGVSVDSQYIDGSEGDNLAFRKFTERETLIDVVNWTTTNPVGNFLATIPVTPCVAKPNGSNTYMLPSVAIPALPFRYWHGSLNYRFKIVSSAYHRGRLRIYWSPTTLGPLAHDIFNELESTVIDIETNKESVITVNYAQPYPWIPTVFQSSADGGAGTNLRTNGFLYVRVSQELNAPLSTADAKILVFISGGDDLSFSSRTGQNLRYFHLMTRGNGNIPMRISNPITFDTPSFPTTIEWQSEIPDAVVHKFSFNNKPDLTNVIKATCGSNITSFRELIKCYHLWEAGWLVFNANAQGTGYISFPPYPLIPGGNTWYTPTVDSGFRLYDSPMTLMASIFRGYKGGIRWKIVFDNDLPSDCEITASLIRQPPGSFSAVGGTYTQSAMTGGNPNPIYAWQNNGLAVARSGNSISFEIPFEFFRMFITLPSAQPFSVGFNNVVVSVYNPRVNTTQFKLPYRAYICAAEDTSFVGYYGPGVSFLYDVFANQASALAAPGIGELDEDGYDENNKLISIVD